MGVKDRAYKAAQTTNVYRQAMLNEQQQALLANQTAYEAEKTDTLQKNTTANMLIRTIDGGVDEIQGYLNNTSSIPTQLIKVVAEARADLLELSGVDTDDYVVDDTATYSFAGTEPSASTAHTTATRNSDSLDMLDAYFYAYVGDTIEYTDTDDSTITTYECVTDYAVTLAKDAIFTGTQFKVLSTENV